MSNIWFSSDLHFNHNREFIYQARGFETLEEMNQTIIERFNSLVKPEDDLYLLGDIMLGKLEDSKPLVAALNGKKHFIIGNHDNSNRVKFYKTLSDDVTYANILDAAKHRFYLSHYPTLTSNLDEGAPIKARVINLCGHSHIKNRFKDMDKGLIYHVEIDCHNNFPISFDEILFDINHFISMDKSDQIDIIKKDIY